jgi:hypothetical protein
MIAQHEGGTPPSSHWSLWVFVGLNHHQMPFSCRAEEQLDGSIEAQVLAR